jgi:tRNA dimethylallyltransferase
MSSNSPARLYLIIGQTASGKGSAAVEAALGMNAEIISADSMKVYKGMDIGTGKPSVSKRKDVPFHLIDVVSPSEPFSVADYVKRADETIADVHGRDKVPIVAGGTALYLKGLTEGIFSGPSAQPEVRAELERIAAEKGVPFLHDELARIDPAAAAKIGVNDLRRLVRALEVFRVTGSPISQFQKQFGTPRDRYESVFVGIRRDREDLARRIDSRVERMFASGFVDEVRGLLAAPGGMGMQASQALGYPEVVAHLNGKASIDETKELIKLRTRQFSKRQMTWFRRVPDVAWLDASPDETAESLGRRVAELMTP